MEGPSPSYRRAFWKSPHHLVLGILTLGLGLATAQELYFLIGAAAYALGWVYLPDFKIFRKWVDHRHNAARQKSALTELEGFKRQRDVLLEALSADGQSRYEGLASVCRDIEKANEQNAAASSGLP